MCVCVCVRVCVYKSKILENYTFLNEYFLCNLYPT